MPWGRLDDSLYDHPKLDLIPVEERLAAIGLWARAISWCNRFLTDGLVPRDRIAKLDGTVDLADLLVAAGLFEPAHHGYQIHDYLAFNVSREKTLEQRQYDADRKAKWRAERDAEKNGEKPPAKSSGRRHTGTPRTKRTNVPVSVPPSVTAESQVESRRDSRTRESRPDPSHIETSPKSPPDGGDHGGSREPGRRAQGTNPRAIAAQQQAEADETRRAIAHRRQQRQLAYLRGDITESQREAMDEADAPLSAMPGYPEHLARLKAEQDAPSPIEADVEAWVS